MRAVIKISILFLLILSIISCKNYEEKKIVQKVYGKWNSENDNLKVELKIDQFKTFNDLIERAVGIVCNDSIPIIILESEKNNKIIYLRNFCWGKGALLIKQKNVIELDNNLVIKNDKIYPLDSLNNILKTDYENNGKNPEYCQNPEKLLIFISYDNNGIKKILNTLNILTESYETVTNKTDVKIILSEKFKIIDLPMPPDDESKNIELLD